MGLGDWPTHLTNSPFSTCWIGRREANPPKKVHPLTGSTDDPNLTGDCTERGDVCPAGSDAAAAGACDPHRRRCRRLALRRLIGGLVGRFEAIGRP